MSRLATRIVPALLALTLVALAFPPWSTWIGSTPVAPPSDYTATLWRWAAGSAALVGGATLLAVIGRDALDTALDARLALIRRIPDRAFVLALGLVTFALAAGLAVLLFDRNPHHVDSVAQLFQGRILARGHLTAPVPEHYEFFGAPHLIRHQGRWLSQYPPGHPLLLVAGLWAGAAWLVNPTLAGATVALIYLIGRRMFDGSAAKLAACLVLISPFALFMSASQMNHVGVALFLSFALYAALRALEPRVGRDPPAGDRGEGARRPSVWAAAGGLALGLAAAVRPLEAAAWAAVLVGWLLLRRRRAGLVLAAGCLLGVLPLLAYNTATTGVPLRFGYTLLWGEGHGLGFHESPWGDPFGPLQAFAYTALDLRMLNERLFAWPFPGLVFPLIALVAVARGWRRLSPRESAAVYLLLALFLVVPLAYFAYWHRDTYLAPRFLYAGLAPITLLSAVGVVALDRRLGRWRSALRLALLAGAVVALIRGLPQRAGEIAGGYPEMKLHPEREIQRAGVEAPLVFVKVGWGSRLIARMWSWGIGASETERSFRSVDGCRLQRGLDRADSLAAAGVDSVRVLAGLAQKLDEWRRADLPVIRGRLPDASVRLDTTRALGRRCLAEARRDTSGFTVYSPLVWRNDPWLERGPIFARDMGRERNARLSARYPDRALYLLAPRGRGPHARPVLRPMPRSVP